MRMNRCKVCGKERARKNMIFCSKKCKAIYESYSYWKGILAIRGWDFRTYLKNLDFILSEHSISSLSRALGASRRAVRNLKRFKEVFLELERRTA